MNTFTVHFEGYTIVQADDEETAIKQVNDDLEEIAAWSEISYVEE